jgi:YidC/Oxa1 family membrane protein insertase
VKEAPSAPEAPLELPPPRALPSPPAQERLLKIDTPLYRAEFSTLGAGPVSWSLKHYKDEQGLSVELLRPGALVPALAVGWTEQFQFAQERFVLLEGGDMSLSASNPEGTLVFEYRRGGVLLRRTYVFRYDSYAVKLRDELQGLNTYMLTLGSGLGIFDPQATMAHVGPVLLVGTERVAIKPKKLKKGMMLFKEDLKWAAQEDKYFFSALVPQVKGLEARVWLRAGEPLVALRAEAAPRQLEFLLYVGPKEHDTLKALGAGLEHVVDFGFFSIIARPLWWLMKRLYTVVGNYGWAIVILTIIIRIPFIPIVNKGQASMKRLQALQPRMQEIRQKYKKDPQRMQREMMELYRRHKVNPMSGCLPMLLQIPVFFALYKVLLMAIELRGAPFALWVQDLSAKDPYYVLPVVMGATMVLQQKLTPAAGDPRQQKLMMLMPVVFTVLFINLPSGLVLYWLVNNVLSIAQQLWVNWRKKA